MKGRAGEPNETRGTRSLKRPPDSESRKPAPSPNYGIIVFILPLYKEGTKVIVESDAFGSQAKAEMNLVKHLEEGKLSVNPRTIG